MDNSQNKQGQDSIGALWKRTSKTSGKEYVAGRLTVPEGYKAGDEIPLAIFPVRVKKDPEKSPDLLIFIRNGESHSSTTTTSTGKPVGKTTYRSASPKRSVPAAQAEQSNGTDDQTLV